MDAELKPCPFCGGTIDGFEIRDDEGNLHDEDYERNPYSGLHYRIIHDKTASPNCPARNEEDTVTSQHDSKEDAIAAWNHRMGMDDVFEALLLLERRCVFGSAPWAIGQSLERFQNKAALLLKSNPIFPADLPVDTYVTGQMAEEIDFLNRMSREIAFRYVGFLKEAHEEQRRLSDGR